MLMFLAVVFGCILLWVSLEEYSKSKNTNCIYVTYAHIWNDILPTVGSHVIMYDGGQDVVGCAVPRGLSAYSDNDHGVNGPMIFVGRSPGCGNWYTPEAFWNSVRYINGYPVVR